MNFLKKNFYTAAFAVVATAVSAADFGNLPLWFESNNAAGATQFIAHGRDSQFVITSDGATFTLQKTDGTKSNARMIFVGGTGARISGIEQLSGKVNYFIGNNPAQWQSGLPTFAKVQIEKIYPGVNVVYYGNRQKLEYDFELAAGVKPETIVIRFDGAEKISVNPHGELVIDLNGGQIIQHAPLAYQTISGQKKIVQADYKMVDAKTVTFAVENVDRTQPLVIDPILSYSTFFGGNYGEIAHAIAINPTDNSIYLAGQTFSTQVSNNIPFAKNGAFTNFQGKTLFGDAFVAKFDNAGTNLLYCTYLGGTQDQVAYALAVDSAGHAFVAGLTESTNFPILNPVKYGGFDGSKISGKNDPLFGHFSSDAFVAELAADGSSLVYSTYFGGNDTENAYGLAIDPAGDAFITGITYSTNFPVTAAAYQNHLVCSNNVYFNGNAFVSEIAAGGNNLNYSTYLGGTNFDVGRAIAYNNGKVFVAGYTISTNFPWTNGLMQCRHLNGFTNTTHGSDAFVTMFTTAGTNLVLQYSTFLGSSNNDVANGIAADASGNAYVVGWTTSTNFPNTTNGVRLSSFVRTNTYNIVIATNAFLTKLTWNGSSVSNSYSQIFGARGVDVANGVTLDASGNIFVVGSASSTNFPTTGDNLMGSLRTTNSSHDKGSRIYSDAFVTVFKSDFSALLYSTYLGGAADDFGNAIAVDSADNAYVTGQTLSTNFPTFNAWHSVMDGTNDAFLAKISMASTPAISASASGGNFLVSWPPNGEANTNTLGLETTTNLLSTNQWLVITQPVPVLSGTNYIYTFNPTNPARFFRFHKF